MGSIGPREPFCRHAGRHRDRSSHVVDSTADVLATFSGTRVLSPMSDDRLARRITYNVWMDNILIRRATESDLPTLGRLGAMLLRTHYAFDPLRFMSPGVNPEEGYAWFLGSQLSEEDVVILVAD